MTYWPTIKKWIKRITIISLILLNVSAISAKNCIKSHNAIIRGDTTRQELALVFTGGDYSDGGQYIARVLKKYAIKAGFFFTGDFYRDSSNFPLINNLKNSDHYLGPHSDQHLLYCSWSNRDSLLITRQKFKKDILDNYKEMKKFGIKKKDSRYFIPPYEWYNRKIVEWADDLGLTLFNFSPGTLSNADYTTPEMDNYRSSREIYNSIINYEQKASNGLNGFILLIHIGSSPKREDKFYFHLDKLIDDLKQKGYNLIRIDNLLQKCE